MVLELLLVREHFNQAFINLFPELNDCFWSLHHIRFISSYLFVSLLAAGQTHLASELVRLTRGLARLSLSGVVSLVIFVCLLWQHCFEYWAIACLTLNWCWGNQFLVNFFVWANFGR
jgi:hypothetical protein